MSSGLPGWEEPTRAEWVTELRALGVVRAATWFDTFMEAHSFAVSFRDGRGEPTDELHAALYGLTGTVVQAVTPEFDDDAEFDEWEGRFGGGELVVDVDARTITVELAYGVREEQEARLSVDLASAQSLFVRLEDENVAEGSDGEWDVEWHAADRAMELGTFVGWFEGFVTDLGVDPGKAHAATARLRDLAANEEDDEDEPDELDPAAAVEVVRGSLAELRKTGVRQGRISYSGGNALLEALGGGTAIEDILAESPWRLGELELDGRRVPTDGPCVSALRTLASVVLVARLGNWNEIGSVRAESGIVDVDVVRGVATVRHRSPRWRRLDPERIVLHADDPA